MTLRVRNFESEKLKVNDHSGNPIQIAAIVVWKVHDTAEALFHVDNYENFVRIQTEAALRNLASSYPYDAHVEGEISLRSHTAEVAEHLKTEIQDRLTQAGVLVIEARFSHLAYAPEIAGVMLQTAASQRRHRRPIEDRRRRGRHGRDGAGDCCRRTTSSSSIIRPRHGWSRTS